jgi:hypothetical protein
MSIGIHKLIVYLVDSLYKCIYRMMSIFISLINKFILTKYASAYFQKICLYYPLANAVAKGYSNATVLPSVRPSHPCEHSRINILQWILTKLGTYLVLKRIWNPKTGSHYIEVMKFVNKIMSIGIHKLTVYLVDSLYKCIYRMMSIFISLINRRDIVTLPSFLPSVRHILVNTLGSTSFNGF